MLEAFKAESLKRHGAAQRALVHYAASLALRPDSYWGHYRAAGMCYGLGRIPEAAGHLEECLQRRPENPVLLGQLAGCLVVLKRYPEALEVCDQALERAPDQAEFYRTRAFIRAKLGHTGGLADDLWQYHSRRHTGDLPTSPIFHDPANLTELPIEIWPAPLGGRDAAEELAAEELAPGEVEKRLRLADAIRDAGDFTAAQTELDKILRSNPDDIPTRMKQVEYAIRDRRFEVARRELDVVLNHPAVIDHLRETPINGLTPFFVVTHRYLQADQRDEAEKVARRASELAGRTTGRDLAKAQYNLAQVLAVKGRTDPRFIQPAAELLAQAFAASPHLRQWYREDRWWFYFVHTQLDAALRQREAPARADGRMALASPVPR